MASQVAHDPAGAVASAAKLTQLVTAVQVQRLFPFPQAVQLPETCNRTAKFVPLVVVSKALLLKP